MRKTLLLLFAFMASMFSANAETYYLIGGGEYFGEWTLSNAIEMPDGEKTLSLPQGNYEFKVLPTNTSWDGQLNASKVNYDKSSANVRGTDNIHVTLAEAGDITVKVEEGELVITGNFSATDLVNVYTLVGDQPLTGSNWDLNDASNAMTLSNGVVTIKKNNVALGATSYKWKVVGDHSWSVQFPASGDFILAIDEAGTYDVEFSLVIATGEGTAVATKTGSTEITSWTVAASQELVGSEWKTDDVANDMTKQDDGSWVLVKDNMEIPAGTYWYKVTANHVWGVQEFPLNGASNEIVFDKASTYKITFTLSADITELTAEVVDLDATAIKEVTAEQNVTKMIDNGEIVIVRNGIRYNVAGVRK